MSLSKLLLIVLLVTAFTISLIKFIQTIFIDSNTFYLITLNQIKRINVNCFNLNFLSEYFIDDRGLFDVER